MHAAMECLDYDIGLQDTFWTGPGEGNWGRPANCADYFAAFQSDPAAVTRVIFPVKRQARILLRR